MYPKKVWLYSIQWFFYCKGISLVHRPFLVLERLSLPQLSPVLLLRWSRSERSSFTSPTELSEDLTASFLRGLHPWEETTLKSFPGIRNISSVIPPGQKKCENPFKGKTKKYFFLSSCIISYAKSLVRLLWPKSCYQKMHNAVVGLNLFINRKKNVRNNHWVVEILPKSR